MMERLSCAQGLEAFFSESRFRFALLLAGLCVLAYLPAFNNGFISDDYVMLGSLDSLWHDPLSLFSDPPGCFRYTSYLCFGILRFLFGYHAAPYYGFNLLLHIANSLLVWRLISGYTRSASTGMLAAVLFATAQGHQEAVMWLAAMNETLLGLFLLSCLVLWETRSAVYGIVAYIAALFSKESALVLIGLLPWFGGLSGDRGRRIAAGLMLLASACFVVLFFALPAPNNMISGGFYALGFHAVPVFFRSMHRMLFPSVYLALAILLAGRRWQGAGVALRGLGFAAVALLPYIFLTYQNHIPSRQEYLASIGIAWSLAVLVLQFKGKAWRNAFVFLFVAANIGYLWFRKDAQFEERAAPTSRLVEVLRENAPQPLAVAGFSGNIWIAKNTCLLVPGWQVDLIHVNTPASECPDCLTYRWDPVAGRYFRSADAFRK